MNERGLGHIEAILSFVIFIIFLIFAFFFFSPFSGNRVLDSSLDYTFREIDSAATIDFESYSVSITSAESGDVAVMINTGVENAGVRVEREDGGPIESTGYDSGSDLVSFTRSEESFVTVMFSEDFSNGGITGELLTDYQISSSESREVYSESKIMELVDKYNSDYEGLKKDDFNLPGRIDLDFKVVFSNGDEMVAERNIPDNLEIISSSDRIEIIRASGENIGKIEFADLIVRVY